MLTYRTLMVPLDGSTFGRHAIPWALTFARPTDATVHLVHVVRPDGIDAPNAVLLDAELARNNVEAQHDALSDLANRLSIGTGVKFQAAVEMGDPSRELARYTGLHGVDLVVMSTHGRGGFGRALLGSVSDGVIRHISRPVLLVRPHSHDPEEHEPAAITDILVPLEGSAEAEIILDHVLEICTLTGAGCVLLHVEVPVLVGGVGPSSSLGDAWKRRSIEADAVEYEARIADRFAHMAERFGREPISVSTAIVQDVDAASGILEYAKSHRVSLIAMSTHGRHGVDRMLFGSTATTVITKTRLPMLVLNRRAFFREHNAA
jgi:nucleotide-binding universal stress UspA family protein